MSSNGTSSAESKSLPSFSLDEEKNEPSIPKELTEAKSFLMHSGDSNFSLWSHLSELLKKITEERPRNIVDYFEEYSRRLKEERFSTVNNHLRDIYIPPKNLETVKKKIDLLRSLGADKEVPADVAPEGEGEENAAVPAKMGFLDQMNFFREAGVCFPIGECYSINIAIRKLSQTEPLKIVRFWGKIFGLEKDYIVAEGELTDEEVTKRLEEEIALEEKAAEEAAKATEEREIEEAKKLEEEKEKEEAERQKLQEEKRASEGAEPLPPPSIRDTYKMPPEPKPPEHIEVVIPKEKYNEGVNKKVYYVCNEPGDEWSVLPTLLPHHIVVARKIKKYFTGDLDKVIVSYPDFNGTEREYLRAQVGRISAATQISPLGYYTFHEPGEEEEEVGEEEEETKSTYVENSEFEPLPMKDLTDPTMAFWVHHSQHILKQGRTKWWNPNPAKSEEEEAAAEEEEEDEGAEKEAPEVGPPLLTPLSEDVSLETTVPWVVRNTSLYTPENASAFVSSNLWPGAYAFAIGKNFGNLYIGWGHKYAGHGYSPAPLPFPESEYEIGPEVMEIDDPTPQAEEEWRLAHEKKPPKAEGEEEQEEEQEGEEDEED